MFSRSKPKNEKNKSKSNGEGRRTNNLAQLGLLDVPNLEEFSMAGDEPMDDTNDDDLEAELLALTQGNIPTRRTRQDTGVNKYSSTVAEQDSDSDIDDPDLLAELASFTSGKTEINPEDAEDIAPLQREAAKPPAPSLVTPAPMQAGSSLVQLLTDRIKIYEVACGNASANGEMSRVRRFKRGLKTLNEMLKAGKAVDENDIPPMISIRSAQPSPVPDYDNSESSPTESGSNAGTPVADKMKSVSEGSEQDIKPVLLKPTPDASHSVSDISDQPNLERIGLVESRLQEYKLAALKAKKEGNLDEALKLFRTAKGIEQLLFACKENQDIDLSSLPSKISDNVGAPQPAQLGDRIVNHPPPVEQSNVQSPADPPVPTTTLGALEQRLEKYHEQMTKAKNEGNARKERMNKRIIKQYQEAITQVKAGRLFDFDELPTPPGYAPIPLPGSNDASTRAPDPAVSPNSPNSKTVPSPTAPHSKQEGITKPEPTRPAPVPQKRAAPAGNVRNNPKSRVERQLSVLKTRQKLFRESALEAKKRGEIEQAKEYLRNSKGIENLIVATEGGLPVDMNTVPIPPQETLASFDSSTNFEVVSKEDCEITTMTDADSAHTYKKLEDDLVEQIKMCARTREHFKALGDVASANRFEQLILHTKKDLDSIRAGFTRGHCPPKFHYETRSFTMIQCNTDLSDSDLEFSVIRGINYNVPNPKEVDTYVKIEFPYPSESPPQDKTDVVKDTNCPEYNHKTTFSIDRKSRSGVRIFKRHGIKCQVITRGGWFHRDTVLGSIKVPLLPLENKCVSHDSYDLIDEKKKMVGGKIETKIRVRNPILSKQLEKVTEKWLVIDGF